MAERILSEETINTFREYLVLEEKSTATVEKYLRDVRAFHLFAYQQAVTKEWMMAYKKYLIEKGYAASFNQFHHAKKKGASVLERSLLPGTGSRWTGAIFGRR